MTWSLASVPTPPSWRAQNEDDESRPNPNDSFGKSANVSAIHGYTAPEGTSLRLEHDAEQDPTAPPTLTRTISRRLTYESNSSADEESKSAALGSAAERGSRLNRKSTLEQGGDHCDEEPQSSEARKYQGLTGTRARKKPQNKERSKTKSHGERTGMFPRRRNVSRNILPAKAAVGRVPKRTFRSTSRSEQWLIGGRKSNGMLLEDSSESDGPSPYSTFAFKKKVPPVKAPKGFAGKKTTKEMGNDCRDKPDLHFDDFFDDAEPLDGDAVLEEKSTESPGLQFRTKHPTDMQAVLDSLCSNEQKPKPKTDKNEVTSLFGGEKATAPQPKQPNARELHDDSKKNGFCPGLTSTEGDEQSTEQMVDQNPHESTAHETNGDISGKEPSKTKVNESNADRNGGIDAGGEKASNNLHVGDTQQATNTSTDNDFAQQQQKQWQEMMAVFGRLQEGLKACIPPRPTADEPPQKESGGPLNDATAVSGNASKEPIQAKKRKEGDNRDSPRKKLSVRISDKKQEFDNAPMNNVPVYLHTQMAQNNRIDSSHAQELDACIDSAIDSFCDDFQASVAKMRSAMKKSLGIIPQQASIKASDPRPGAPSYYGHFMEHRNLPFPGDLRVPQLTAPGAAATGYESRNSHFMHPLQPQVSHGLHHGPPLPPYYTFASGPSAMAGSNLNSAQPRSRFDGNRMAPAYAAPYSTYGYRIPDESYALGVTDNRVSTNCEESSVIEEHSRGDDSF